MIQFRPNKIKSENEIIAEDLKQARLRKKLNLKEIAKKININYKYLKILEKGEFDKLPAGIYGKNFLKEYAIFLGLDYQKITKIFSEMPTEGQSGEINKEKNKELFSKQIVKGSKLIIFPKIIKSIIIIMIVSGCFLYLGVCLNKIISPPRLNIVEPSDNLITKNSFINIIGTTEPEAEVTINGEFLSIDSDGSFTEKVNLKNGVNTLIITAKKKYGREIIVKKQILVEE
ncbi:MAG: helix-turn-helix domain-containing protein [Patescibacteria group bacterium]